jgi:NTE family protein
VNTELKIGLALGSGSARGWSHIGIIKELAELGIVPNIVCGTSIGALVGASYVSNNIDKLEEWACSLTKFEAAKFFDINLSMNGFVNIEKFHHFLNEYVASDDILIENYSKRYAAVATELATGREIWLTKGSIVEAVWSSISMPSLFPAIKLDNKWLVDGGLVNPVPISVCRALGADIVIAVNLNGDIMGRQRRPSTNIVKPKKGVTGKLTELVREYSGSFFTNTDIGDQPPGLFDAIAHSINITQDRITRSRMAGDPADIILSPRLAEIGLLEIYRAGEAIDEGRRCVRRMATEITDRLKDI